MYSRVSTGWAFTARRRNGSLMFCQLRNVASGSVNIIHTRPKGPRSEHARGDALGGGALDRAHDGGAAGAGTEGVAVSASEKLKALDADVGAMSRDIRNGTAEA